MAKPWDKIYGSNAMKSSDLLKKYKAGISSLPIGEIEVRPGDQVHMSLGLYEKNKQLKGFSIELTPDPQDEDAIVTHIASLNKNNQEDELIFHIANYGDRTIGAEIRELL